METKRTRKLSTYKELIIVIGLFRPILKVIVWFFITLSAVHPICAKMDLTEILFKDFQHSALPLVYFVERDQDYSYDPHVALEVLEVIMDGVALTPTEVIANTGYDTRWRKSGSGWRQSNLFLYGHPNLFYIEACATTSLMMEWVIPDEWKTLEVTYRQRSKTGETLSLYRLIAQRK